MKKLLNILGVSACVACMIGETYGNGATIFRTNQRLTDKYQLSDRFFEGNRIVTMQWDGENGAKCQVTCHDITSNGGKINIGQMEISGASDKEISLHGIVGDFFLVWSNFLKDNAGLHTKTRSRSGSAVDDTIRLGYLNGGGRVHSRNRHYWSNNFLAKNVLIGKIILDGMNFERLVLEKKIFEELLVANCRIHNISCKGITQIAISFQNSTFENLTAKKCDFTSIIGNQISGKAVFRDCGFQSDIFLPCTHIEILKCRSAVLGETTLSRCKTLAINDPSGARTCFDLSMALDLRNLELKSAALYTILLDKSAFMGRDIRRNVDNKFAGLFLKSENGIEFLSDNGISMKRTETNNLSKTTRDTIIADLGDSLALYRMLWDCIGSQHNEITRDYENFSKNQGRFKFRLIKRKNKEKIDAILEHAGKNISGAEGYLFNLLCRLRSVDFIGGRIGESRRLLLRFLNGHASPEMFSSEHIMDNVLSAMFLLHSIDASSRVLTDEERAFADRFFKTDQSYRTLSEAIKRLSIFIRFCEANNTEDMLAALDSMSKLHGGIRVSHFSNLLSTHGVSTEEMEDLVGESPASIESAQGMAEQSKQESVIVLDTIDLSDDTADLSEIKSAETRVPGDLRVQQLQDSNGSKPSMKKIVERPVVARRSRSVPQKPASVGIKKSISQNSEAKKLAIKRLPPLPSAVKRSKSEQLRQSNATGSKRMMIVKQKNGSGGQLNVPLSTEKKLTQANKGGQPPLVLLSPLPPPPPPPPLVRYIDTVENKVKSSKEADALQQPTSESKNEKSSGSNVAEDHGLFLTAVVNPKVEIPPLSTEKQPIKAGEEGQHEHDSSTRQNRISQSDTDECKESIIHRQEEQTLAPPLLPPAPPPPPPLVRYIDKANPSKNAATLQPALDNSVSDNFALTQLQVTEAMGKRRKDMKGNNMERRRALLGLPPLSNTSHANEDVTDDSDASYSSDDEAKIPQSPVIVKETATTIQLPPPAFSPEIAQSSTTEVLAGGGRPTDDFLSQIRKLGSPEDGIKFLRDNKKPNSERVISDVVEQQQKELHSTDLGEALQALELRSESNSSSSEEDTSDSW
ncbi:MAG: hypothetical protein LBQ08_04645 [Holosporaceae bacterium]|nr:hypothetical protein [Holosporaceae bacterium]